MHRRDLNRKFKVRMVWTEMIGKVLPLSSSFAPKVRFTPWVS